MGKLISLNTTLSTSPAPVSSIQNEIHVLPPIAGEKPESHAQWNTNDHDVNPDIDVAVGALDPTKPAQVDGGGMVVRTLLLLAVVVGILLLYQGLRLMRRKLRANVRSPSNYSYGRLNNPNSGLESNAQEDSDEEITLHERN